MTASTEGSKKLYTITDEGRAYLETNRDLVDVVFDRLSALGERVNRWRRTAPPNATTAANCRRSSKPRLMICAQRSASVCKATTRPRQSSSKSSSAPTPTCSDRDILAPVRKPARR